MVACLSIVLGVPGMVGTGIAHGISRLRVAGVAIQALVDANTVASATLFCITVGLFFGIYPAVRAARLNPVDALR